MVSYDISDEKRLRRIYSTMLGYGDPLQYSVFLCDLSAKEMAILVTNLHDLIKVSEDSVIIINLGVGSKVNLRRMKFLGVKKKFKERKAIIV